MNNRLLDILPHLLLPPPILPKPLIPLPDLPPKVKLPIRRVARHQLRLPERQRVPAVDLPQVVRLAVELHDLRHLHVLGHLPRRAGHAAVRHDEHPGLNLVGVRVPEPALRAGERLVERGRYHVFDADEACGGGVGVVEQALADVIV